MKYLIVLLALCWIVGISAQEKVFLKFNLEKNKTYKIKISSDQSIEQEFMGNRQDVKQMTGYGLDFKVEEIYPDGSMQLKVVYNWTAFKQKTMFGEIEYDSKNPPQTVPENAKVFDLLAGKGYSLKMAQTGEILEVMGMEKLSEEIVNSLDISEKEMKNMVKKQIETQFGKEVFSSYLMFPPRSLAMQETWSKSDEIYGALPMILINQWTIKEKKGDAFILDLKSEIKPNSNAKPIEMEEMKIRYMLTGKQSGVLEVDGASGWLQKATVEQEIEAKAHLDAAMVPEGTVIPMKIKGTITIVAE